VTRKVECSLGVALIAIACGSIAPSPVADPTLPPLAQLSDLHYQGSFRLPEIDLLRYGGSSVSYHDAKLLVQARDNVFVDVAIPTLGTGAYGELPVATIAETYAHLDAGRRLWRNPADTNVRGTLFTPSGGLVMSVASYYDASHSQTTSHLRRELGSGQVTAHTLAPVGHTAGYMTLATGELAPALTGNFGLPIVTRESFGPAAFIFDPDRLDERARPVLDYPDASRALGPWNGTSDLWNSRSTLGGLALFGRSLFFVGIHGTGPFCYGGDACHDPEGNDQGSHAYPYVYRIWAYDTADLIKVKNGHTQPWDPRPYGVWTLELPFTSSWHHLVAAASDPATNRLFILQGFGDPDPARGFPVIHVYRVGSRELH